MKHRRTARRPLALTAAATIALSGLFVSTPAFAEDPAGQPADPSATTSETAAPTAPAETEAPAAPAETEAPATTSETEAPTAPAETEAPAEAQALTASPAEAPAAAPSDEVVEAVEDAAEKGVEIVAFGVNGAGEDAVVVTEESADEKAAIKAFAQAADLDKNAAVTIVDGPLEAFAEGDVVGGQGYVTVTDADLIGGACSVGFAAWAPDRTPALLSAGHCAFDGDGEKFPFTTLTVPGEEPAVGGEGFVLPASPEVLGTYGFAQFGSTGNAAGSVGDTEATDISVIDLDAAGGWNPLPAVTDWSTAGASLDSLAASTIPIKAVGAPKVGAVSKSGRTTGFTSGTVEASDLVAGWANISGKFVQGFSTDTVAAPGDSGGAVFQGNTAVGLISGGREAGPGVEQFTWAASLVTALPKTGGYEVALDLDAPAVTSPADGATVTPGQTVTGTAPGATEVTVTQTGTAEPQTVAVEGGTFSFAGPVDLGPATISITSVNGMSQSAVTTINVLVAPAPLVAPVITSPADGRTFTTPITSIVGTGLPTAGIVVEDAEGNELGTATVGATGDWTVTGVDLGYGPHSIVVTQTRGVEVSPEATSAFSVVPVAPAVTSITDGATFPHDGGPTQLSGTGIEGAAVTVTLNGAEPASGELSALAARDGVFTATVENGEWSVSFGDALEPGDYRVAATQSVEGVASAPTDLAFAVLAAPVGGGGDGGGEGDGGVGGGGGAAPGDDGGLAATGADMFVPLTSAAFALALLSAGLLLVLRRRKMLEA